LDTAAKSAAVVQDRSYNRLLAPQANPIARPPLRLEGAMPDTRVIAYFMHEGEQTAATSMLTNVEVTDSYVIGDIDEARIADLQRAGLIVQPMPAPDVGASPSVAFARSVELRSARARRRAPTPAMPAGPVVDPNRPAHYLLQISGPLLREYRETLRGLGVTLSERVAGGTYVTKLTPAQIAPVRGLRFVTGLTVYGETETGLATATFGTRAMAPAPATGSTPMSTYDIQIHDPGDLAQALAAVRALGVSVAGSKGRKIRVYVLENEAPARLVQLRALPQVKKIEPYVEPELHNDVARVLLGVEPAGGANPAAGLTETGAGQIVAVADTGLDDQHPDFQGRIVGLVALGRPGDATDPHGHGTHVSGSVLGNGAASGGQFRGVAPAASLYFQSLLDANFRLGGLPLDLADLFDDAYQNGARIHNNSWGAVVDSEYTMNSQEADDFVAAHRDMLVVISAGNEGQAASQLHAQPGMVDWLSIGAPASCKNALTVGASRSSRTSGGYSTLTYGAAWPDDFPDPPAASGTVSGDPDALAAFSSRGPCTDRRVKPDVVAPGTDILSAKSSRAPLHRFWGPGPSPKYAYMGGTSMAAPLVAGCAALVREYYVATRGHAAPSAALLKATLVNSTRHLPGADAIADFNVLPNMHQGFGVVNMPFAYPNPMQPLLRLEFLDDWQTPASSFTVTGQRRRFQVGVAAGVRLSICLVWTDAPGRALQNNLNLLVELPGGVKVPGNQNLPLALGPVDQENNVELVRVDAPAAGNYLIQIFASNLLTADQDFALVVTGALTTGLVPVP
jgi:subtilisin family serine protease